MDLLTLTRILLRRWYVVVAFLALTVSGAGLTYSSITPSYQTTGSILLLNPPAQVDPDTGKANPYVGNLIVAAQVVTNIIDSPAYRRDLLSQGVLGSYVLGVDPNSPIIRVISTADTPAASKATTTEVMAKVSRVLQERQEDLGATRSILVTTQVITPPSEAVPLNGSRIRAALALFAVGIALTVGAAFAAEGVTRHRNTRSEWLLRRQPRSSGSAGDTECPLCEAILPSGKIVQHLSDAHGLRNQEGISALYDVRQTRDRELRAAADKRSRRSNPGG